MFTARTRYNGNDASCNPWELQPLPNDPGLHNYFVIDLMLW